MSTPSLLNAQQTRDFISQHHSSVYAALDPALVNLPSPFNVVIVGGSGAAGTALAKSYALAGASGIVLAARTKSAIEDVAKDVRSINPSLKVVSVGCDTTSNTDVANLADVVRQEFNGHLDVVVQNCGFSGPLAKATIVEEDPTDVQKAFDIHAVGTWLVAHYLLPFLLATESGARSFLAISSIAAPGLIGFGATSHYCASKVAQARLIEIMHAQYSHQGIFCSAVHPGGMQSDFARAASPDIQHLLNDDPALVGAFCVWLTNDERSERKRQALNGRFLSCKWDITELEARFSTIEEKDLLRFRLALE